MMREEHIQDVMSDVREAIKHAPSHEELPAAIEALLRFDPSVKEKEWEETKAQADAEAKEAAKAEADAKAKAEADAKAAAKAGASTTKP